MSLDSIPDSLKNTGRFKFLLSVQKKHEKEIQKIKEEGDINDLLKVMIRQKKEMYDWEHHLFWRFHDPPDDWEKEQIEGCSLMKKIDSC